MHARMRKHAHTDQYVILIAFPQQKWFRERASMLRYTYIACLCVIFNVFHKEAHEQCLFRPNSFSELVLDAHLEI
jgi:hypothetical protein